MSYRAIATGLAALAAGFLSADDVPFVWNSWFNEDYSGIDAATWADTAGTWTRSTSDGSSIEELNGERYLQVGAAPGDLRFSAPSSSGSYKPVCVDSHMTFVASRNGEEYASAPTDSYAGLILRMTETENATNLTFVGWTARNWTELSSPDVTPAEDTYFDVRIELDLSVRPNKVRYSVDGHVLAAADGSTWLDANTSGRGNKAYGANDNVKDHVHHVVFCGTGRVGAFSGKQASTIAPRATVAFDASVSNRVAAGSTLSFGVTPNDGATVGTLRYVWRRVDSVFSRSDDVLATTADYTVTAADYGHWLIVEAYDENGYVGAASNYVSRLPVLYIQTDDGTMPTAQKEEHTATMRTVLGETQFSSKEIYSGPLTIKVRGNTTKGLPKKPYKLKLDSKTNMFGLDPNGVKNKHWVLLANYYDEGMLRNKIAYDMSHELGVPVWQKSTWVDVILNGQFLGCYQFCQHIRVGEDRVNIYDWEDAAETVGKAALKNAEIAAQLAAIGVTDKGQFSENFSWVNTGVFSNELGTVDISSVKGVKKNDISGGYLFELSNEYDELSQFQIKAGIKDSLYKVMLNKPEYLFTSDLMMDVCRNYWTDLFDAWTSGRGTSAAGSNWLDLCDLDSMTGYWLTMYIMGNSDSSYKSRFAYLDRGTKMVMGPVWDFDWGCGSPQVRKWGTNDVGQVYLKDPSPTGWAPGGNVANFMAEWCSEPYFCMKLREKYLACRPYLTALLQDNGIYDQHVAYIRESGAANETRWFYRTGFSGETGDAAVFKQFLKDRVAWLDGKFATLDTTVSNIGTLPRNYPLRPATSILTPSFPGLSGDPAPDQPITVSVAVSDERAATLDVFVNGRFLANTPVANGVCTQEIPAGTLMGVPGTSNLVSFLARTSTGTYLTNKVSNANVATRNYAPVVVSGARTRSTTLTHNVPYSYLDELYPAITNNAAQFASDAAYDGLAEGASPFGKSIPLWQDYVAGTDPTDEDDRFTANIAVTNDQVYISWGPDLNKGGQQIRVYTIKGAAELTDTFTAPTNSASRFFKVEVSLP